MEISKSCDVRKLSCELQTFSWHEMESEKWREHNGMSWLMQPKKDEGQWSGCSEVFSTGFGCSVSVFRFSFRFSFSSIWRLQNEAAALYLYLWPCICMYVSVSVYLCVCVDAWLCVCVCGCIAETGTRQPRPQSKQPPPLSLLHLRFLGQQRIDCEPSLPFSHILGFFFTHFFPFFVFFFIFFCIFCCISHHPPANAFCACVFFRFDFPFFMRIASRRVTKASQPTIRSIHYIHCIHCIHFHSLAKIETEIACYHKEFPLCHSNLVVCIFKHHHCDPWQKHMCCATTIC